MNYSRNRSALITLQRFLIDLIKSVLALAIIGIFVLMVWMVLHASENTSSAKFAMMQSNDLGLVVDNLISQQTVTLTVTGVSVALFAIFATLFVGVREYTIKSQKNQIKHLIQDLNEIYETLVIINSFQGLRDHNLMKTKRALMQQTKSSKSILALHYQLDELYTYTSYKGQRPPIQKAYEAYLDVQEIYGDIEKKFSNDQDVGNYSSIEYLTLLKAAEAGYNLLANSLDTIEAPDELSAEKKKEIYLTSCSYLKQAKRINGDPDGFISCREGLLMYLRVQHCWENLTLDQEENMLCKAKDLLKKAVAANDNDNAIWYNNLCVICIQLSRRAIDKSNFERSTNLLDEATENCNHSLRKDCNAYNTHLSLLSIVLYRIATCLKISPSNCLSEANYTIAEDKEAQITSDFIIPGIQQCKLAIQLDKNKIGAYRKLIALYCVQSKSRAKEKSDVLSIFRSAIELANEAKCIEIGMKQKFKSLNRDLDMLAAHIKTNIILSQEKKTDLLSILDSIY